MNKRQNTSISRRRFIKTALGGTASIVLLGPGGLGGTTDQHQDLWFTQITDPHSGGEETPGDLQFVLDDITATFPESRFTLVTGDISEHGWEEELDEFHQVMESEEVQYYPVMGNHDSRWTRSGRQAFIERFGATRWVIRQGPVTLLAIDSSVLLEQYGFLDPSELDWVEAHLESLNGKPAILAFHHPPSQPKQFLGSEKRLYRLAARFNIPAILAGHIHSLQAYQVNGTRVLTSGSTHPPSRGYSAFRVTSTEIIPYHRNPVSGTTEEREAIPLRKDQRKTPAVETLEVVPTVTQDGHLTLPLPWGNPTKEIQLLINGSETESSRQSGKLTCDLRGYGKGSYELTIVTPSVNADRQKRRWGEFSLEGKGPDPVWRRQLGSAIQCRPAMDDENLYAGTNGGVLYALNRLTGETRWTFNPEEGAILSGPVLQKDRLFLGSTRGQIRLLSPEDGTVLWKRPVDGSVISTARMTEEMIYFGTGNGLLYAVNLRDGDVRWTFEAGNHIKATPAYDGDRLYVGAWDGHFYSVDARSGDLVWKKRINTPHFSPATSNPKLLNGRVYFVSHDYRTHCFDAETGDVIWQYPGGDIEFQWNSPIVAECKPSYSSAVFHGETVYFCSLTGHVVGFHQDTGELVFQKQVSGPVFDSFPVLVRDIMYFGTTRGALNALNLRTGEMAWEYSTGYHYIFSGPATDGQLLALGNMGGWLSVFPVSAEG